MSGFSDKETIEEVKAALPHQSSFLDELGGGALAFLVDEIGSAFERELLSMLRDEPRSEIDLQQDGVLMAAAEKVIDSNRPESYNFRAEVRHRDED